MHFEVDCGVGVQLDGTDERLRLGCREGDTHVEVDARPGLLPAREELAYLALAPVDAEACSTPPRNWLANAVSVHQEMAVADPVALLGEGVESLVAHNEYGMMVSGLRSVQWQWG
jgi:hypothetical protein